MSDIEYGAEIAEAVERMYRRSRPGYDLERQAEERRRYLEENRERLERERYERLSPAYQRRLREREALARRAHGIFRALGGVLYGGAFHLGSPADPDRVEEARDEILRTVDVPEAKLAAILDGWLSRVEAGDGRGARAFLEEAAEELAQAGHRARPEDLDPRELAARIPRGPVFVQG